MLLYTPSLKPPTLHTPPSVELNTPGGASLKVVPIENVEVHSKNVEPMYWSPSQMLLFPLGRLMATGPK